jgi:hypothetical protein
MFRTPTAVLMMTGQIAVMKMTKIADGCPSRNAASDRNRAQDLEERIERAHRPLAAADEHAERDAAGGREEIAEADAFQAREQVPEEALVVTAVVIQRIHDELPRVRDHL